MSENEIENENENELALPCGCRRAFVKRQAPAFDATGAPEMEDGAFVMEEVEEIQEFYCDEHTIKLIEHQQEIQKLLVDGKQEAALQLSQGVSPFPLLSDGSDS